MDDPRPLPDTDDPTPPDPDPDSELQRLQHEAALASAAARGAEQELIALRERAATVEAERDTLRAGLDDAAARSRDAADRYRALMLRAEPSLPADLIAGDDVDAIDASVDAARVLVARVRAGIEAQTQAARVPAGAPARAAPDLSSLSPEQKIRYGLTHRAS